VNIEPRTRIIRKRLSRIANIITVTGWKGGVGKSSLSCVLALVAAKNGKRTGLMDLDFTGACCDAILGVENAFPEETGGLEPPVVAGVKFMSASFFTGRRALHLRGHEITDAILELLAVTQWRELDYLFLDMPPGISDAALDVVRWIPEARILAVVNPSILSYRLVEKSISLFRDMRIPFIGVVENMSDKRSRRRGGLPVIARISRDSGFERAIGNPESLLKTRFAREAEAVLEYLDARPPVESLPGRRRRRAGSL